MIFKAKLEAFHIICCGCVAVKKFLHFPIFYGKMVYVVKKEMVLCRRSVMNVRISKEETTR